MSINIPPIIQKYIDASNAHDVKSILPCFKLFMRSNFISQTPLLLRTARIFLQPG